MNKIRPRIEKGNAVMRDAVSAEERLSATLKFLSTEKIYENLKLNIAISPQLLSKIIPEVCTAIYEESKRKYLKVKFLF